MTCSIYYYITIGISLDRPEELANKKKKKKLQHSNRVSGVIHKVYAVIV